MLMEKYSLSAEEVFIINLLFLASIEEGHAEYLVKYFNLNIDKSDLRESLLNLQQKGIITKSYKVPAKGKPFDPEAVEFNKNFLHNYRKFSGELGRELFNEYPSIAIIGGAEAFRHKGDGAAVAEAAFFNHAAGAGIALEMAADEKIQLFCFK